MDAVEDIKQRLNIEDVIGEYVQLKRAGRNFKGLSPFNSEKTPSFMVSPEKQIWHDFSSGKGGNMFSFVMEVEGLDFKSALELLARKAGVDLEQYRGQSNGFNAKLKTRVLEALELATRFYQKQLMANPFAFEYIAKARELTKDTLLAWQIGYAPNTGRALSDFLTKQGFTAEEMKRAGLAVERRHGLGDMFRGRIMIPLADQQGTVVGFTARLLRDEPEAPKYINTPQTLVYDKSRQVFGLHLAKERIRKAGFVVVVEGNMDVIASWQAGVTNVVATAGTAMTEMHLKILKRFTEDIRLCFDADQAGLTATERTIPLAQKAGAHLGIIEIKGAKDPDELIHTDVNLWKEAIGTSQYAVDWLISHYQAIHDLTSAEGKRAFSDVVLGTLRRLSDPVEKEHYVKQIAKLTDTTFEAMSAKLTQRPGTAKKPLKPLKAPPQAVSKADRERRMLQDHLLAILLAVPRLRDELGDIQPEWFDDGPPRELAAFLRTHPAFKGDPKESEHLQTISDYVKIVSLQFEELYQDLSPDELREVIARLKKRLIKTYVQKQNVRLANAMHTSNERETKKMLQEVQKLNRLIK